MCRLLLLGICATTLLGQTGPQVTGADLLHGLGVQGDGVRICHIDSGFASLPAAIASGALPPVTIHDPTGSLTAAPFDHGTASLEIIHAMAPGAQLFLAVSGTGPESVQAAQWAVAQGCDIVTFGQAFTFGDYWGPGPDLAHEVVSVVHAAGALFVAPAGNQAARHQGGVFVDQNGDGFMDWGVHGDSLPVTLSPGTFIHMVWDAWPTTAVDYDLEIIDAQGNVVADANGVQSGSQPPHESIPWFGNTTSSHRIRVRSTSLPAGESHRDLKIHLWGPSQFPLGAQRPSGSIALPAAVPEALAVGAVPVSQWATGTIAAYSSHGPAPEAPQIAKPELIAPADVFSPVWGGPFGGTSAAGPHVAGAAALFLQMEPGLRGVPGALRSALLSWADPVIATSPFAHGHGRLRLPASAVDGYEGRCVLSPTVPRVGDVCTLSVEGAAPGAPFTVVVDLDASPVLWTASAIHVGTVSPWVLVTGLGAQGIMGTATLSPQGSWSWSFPTFVPPLGQYGVHAQAAFLGPSGIEVTTPAVLDL